jgi:hypothetical protein
MNEPRFVYIKEDLAVSLDLVEGFRVAPDGPIEVWLSTDRWGDKHILEGEMALRFQKEIKTIAIAGEKPKGGPRSTPII